MKRQKAGESKCSLSSVHCAPRAGKSKRTPWNKGKKMGKSDLQHLFVPKEEVQLFLAVTLWFAGPKYALVLWLTMVTSRRISETLRLHAEDFYLNGGPHHDSPHVLFLKKKEESKFAGNGKLGADTVVARLAQDASETLQEIMKSNIERCVLPALRQYEASHSSLFESPEHHPLSTEPYAWPSSGRLFPASTKKAKRPWMARQSVSLALSRARRAMFALTGKRRWNGDFMGSHVTVHGATRHTAAALLMGGKATEPAIMEIQQRHDVGTFRRHYCHAQEKDVVEALENASLPVSFQAKSLQAVDHLACQTAPAGGNGSCPAMPKPPTMEVKKGSWDGDGKNTVPCPVSNGDTFSATAPAQASSAARDDPLPAMQDSPKCSRNAWRKRKRRDGLKAWQAKQDVSPGCGSA